MRIGEIVVSLCGRDSDRIFVVVGLEGGYALLCDGKLRRIENPKRKKLKHIKSLGVVDEDLSLKIASGEKLLNAEYKKCLARFRAEH